MTTAKTLLLALACTLPFYATALDSSADVKVTPILKTTTSWNGAPIMRARGGGVDDQAVNSSSVRALPRTGRRG
ncbi:MAG: hypothetical protein OSB41_15350 [Kiritimatiellae bacterium]|nr:hypothetical protein [Kiritimatiellia bacterium]